METALGIIQTWINNSKYKIQVIPRSDLSDKCEDLLGITEHSTLGTLINHVGGLSVANGVIRHFCGNNTLGLSIKSVNLIDDGKPNRIKNALIVADDIYGGIFAISNSTFLAPQGKMLYLPPDSYIWENLNIGHSSFVEWSMSENVITFYKKYMNLPVEKNVPFNNVINYTPPLWSQNLSKDTFNYTLIDSLKMLKIRTELLEQLS